MYNVQNTCEKLDVSSLHLPIICCIPPVIQIFLFIAGALEVKDDKEVELPISDKTPPPPRRATSGDNEGAPPIPPHRPLICSNEGAPAVPPHRRNIYIGRPLKLM